MDADAKVQFKWKFYRLTVEFNIIVLLIAMSVPVFLIIHSPYTIPIIIGMLALALLVLWDFLGNYRETKAWLDDVAEKETEQKGKTET